MLFIVVLAPLIIPTDVLLVPLFSMFRAVGLINSLPGLGLFNVMANVSDCRVSQVVNIKKGIHCLTPKDLRASGSAASVEGVVRYSAKPSTPSISAIPASAARRCCCSRSPTSRRA